MAKLYEMMSSIYFCLKLNISFLVGCLVGLFFLGVGPSLLTVIHMVKLRQDGDEPPFISTFISTYRASFKAGNALILPLVILLSSSLYLLLYQNATKSKVIIIMAIVSLVVEALMILTISSMYEYYQLSLKEYFLKALAFIGYNPVILAIPLLWLAVCVGASFFLPGIIPFLSIGVWGYVDVNIYTKIFDDNENKLQKEV